MDVLNLEGKGVGREGWWRECIRNALMIVEARYCIKLGIIGGEEWGGRIFTIAKWA